MARWGYFTPIHGAMGPYIYNCFLWSHFVPLKEKKNGHSECFSCYLPGRTRQSCCCKRCMKGINSTKMLPTSIKAAQASAGEGGLMYPYVSCYHLFHTDEEG